MSDTSCAPPSEQTLSPYTDRCPWVSRLTNEGCHIGPDTENRQLWTESLGDYLQMMRILVKAQISFRVDHARSMIPLLLLGPCQKELHLAHESEASATHQRDPNDISFPFLAFSKVIDLSQHTMNLRCGMRLFSTSTMSQDLISCPGLADSYNGAWEGPTTAATGKLLPLISSSP